MLHRVLTTAKKQCPVKNRSSSLSSLITSHWPLATVFLLLASWSRAQVVNIPDPNLRVAVAERTGADPVRITAVDLRSLRSFTVRGREIENLEGLQHARNLTRLDLAYNLISDLTPLVNLANLEGLSLQGNAITDISPLAELTNLRHLTLYDNRITNINALSGMKQLLEFEAQGNAITDINALSELLALEHLHVAGNLISEINPLTNLVNLEVLKLHRNAIVDISALAGLTNLRHLTIENNAITDISALAGLTNLRHLTLQNNDIADHSPVDGLALDTIIYDQICDMPPEPLEPRLANRTFPSIFRAFSGTIINIPDLVGTYFEMGAKHDAVFTGLPFGSRWLQISDEWHVTGVMEDLLERRSKFFSLNPNMIFLAEVRLRDSGGSIPSDYFPDDHPYWLRLPSGEIAHDEEPRLINFAHPDVQDIIVGQALAIARCGLYDGVFFDWWNDFDSTVGDLISLEDAVRARKNIIDRIRVETRDDFLVVGNVNHTILPITGPQMNGGFMESLTTGPRELIHQKVRDALEWLETNLREPRTVMLEGGTDPSEPPDSPYNLQLMRAITTMSLTHSDGYVLFEIGRGHVHYWYDFWDVDLGRPVGPKFQFYEEIEKLYIREFTNGWAVYNQSGEAQVVTLPDEVQSAANGLVNTEHGVLNIDGDIFLRTAPKEPADVNGDGLVNILDLTLVARGFGTDDPNVDINGDGVVNVFDLVFIANRF